MGRMLTTLRISGFAVVDEISVHFGPGLNVLTGETGAGKTILVNALHLVLGGRTTADVLREGADEAVVEALFELPVDHPAFERLGLAPLSGQEDHRGETSKGAAAGSLPRGEGCAVGGGTRELLVRRVLARGGRGRASVNGALCTVSMLEAALRGVVDISGQHEHVSLLDPAVHLELLDAYAGSEGREPSEEGRGDGGLLGRYGEAYAALADRVKERDLLLAEDGERARRADYLAFLLGELDQVNPRPGELEELLVEKRVLASAERLREAARGAEGLAYGEEGSAAERVGQAVRALSEAVALDPQLEGPLCLLKSAGIELEEAGRALSRYAEGVGGDPDRLSAVGDRIELLRALSRKHGGSLETALARREALGEELARLRGGGERLGELAQEIEASEKAALALADELSRLRALAATRLSEAVKRELGGLSMGRCRVEVILLPPEGGIPVGGRTLSQDGAERAEILIAPNPGEPPRPLSRIASGGELSRFLLAMKRVLARRDPVATYVFDEVDAGIGGAVAESMGRVLAEVSGDRQVVCVTHLPQVAAFADRHHRVDKAISGGRTRTEVTWLVEEEDRRREVARMMAGRTVTVSALEHAASLIAEARRTPAAVSRGELSVPRRTAAHVAGRGRGGRREKRERGGEARGPCVLARTAN